MGNHEDQPSLLKRGIFGRFTFNDVIFLLFTLTGYVIAVALIHPSMGTEALILITFPIILYGWRWGAMVGLVSGILTVPFNSVLLFLLRESEFTILFSSWTSLIGTVLVVVTGGVVGHLSDLFDKLKIKLTERKHAEDELQKVMKELERSNTELEQFAYVASHDLHEPLRMVSSFMELLRERSGDRLDDDAKEFVHFAIDGTERMQKLIDALLVYSHVDSKGKSFVPTDCNAILNQVLDNLQLSVKESDAVIVADNLPIVIADDVQLLQLFQNLIGNSLKFQKDAQPTVEIRVSEENHNYIFSIVDNGIGIDPENSTRIFEMSHRLHSQDEYPGTGIGLATCKKIVERHGGRIWVDSELGHGSTFFFALPRPSDRDLSVDLNYAPVGDVAGEANRIEDKITLIT